MENQRMKLVNHSLYSPDLAPCGFWLFDYLKHNLNSNEDEITIKRAVTELLGEIPKKEYRKTFEKWKE